MCLSCQEPTLNPKFCSRSCSASYTNRVNPKRAPEHTCSFYDCQEPVTSRRKYCNHHSTRYMRETRTIGDYRASHSTHGNAYKSLRSQARRWYLLNYKDIACINCGYDKHVEVAHLIALKDFSDDTPVTKVNAETNLAGLCRNCHWEWDNGLLHIMNIVGPNGNRHVSIQVGRARAEV